MVVRDASGTEVRQRVLLVRGHEKSGTTWLRALLALHPSINMAPKEFQFNFVSSGIERFTSEPWMGAVPTLSRLAHQWFVVRVCCSKAVRHSLISRRCVGVRSCVRYDEFVHAMLGAVAVKHPDKTWIAEKSPKPIEPIHVGAHYVYLLRDGRDVLVSLFWHHVRIGLRNQSSTTRFITFLCNVPL